MPKSVQHNDVSSGHSLAEWKRQWRMEIPIPESKRGMGRDMTRALDSPSKSFTSPDQQLHATLRAQIDHSREPGPTAYDAQLSDSPVNDTSADETDETSVDETDENSVDEGDDISVDKGDDTSVGEGDYTSIDERGDTSDIEGNVPTNEDPPQDADPNFAIQVETKFVAPRPGGRQHIDTVVSQRRSMPGKTSNATIDPDGRPAYVKKSTTLPLKGSLLSNIGKIALKVLKTALKLPRILCLYWKWLLLGCFGYFIWLAASYTEDELYRLMTTGSRIPPVVKPWLSHCTDYLKSNSWPPNVSKFIQAQDELVSSANNVEQNYDLAELFRKTQLAIRNLKINVAPSVRTPLHYKHVLREEIEKLMELLMILPKDAYWIPHISDRVDDLGTWTKVLGTSAFPRWLAHVTNSTNEIVQTSYELSVRIDIFIEILDKINEIVADDVGNLPRKYVLDGVLARAICEDLKYSNRRHRAANYFANFQIVKECIGVLIDLKEKLEVFRDDIATRELTMEGDAIDAHFARLMKLAKEKFNATRGLESPEVGDQPLETFIVLETLDRRTGKMRHEKRRYLQRSTRTATATLVSSVP